MSKSKKKHNNKKKKNLQSKARVATKKNKKKPSSKAKAQNNNKAQNKAQNNKPETKDKSKNNSKDKTKPESVSEEMKAEASERLMKELNKGKNSGEAVSEKEVRKKFSKKEKSKENKKEKPADAKKAKKKQDKVQSAIGISLFIIFLALIVVFLIKYGLPHTIKNTTPTEEATTKLSVDDPFKYITVEFDGLNGEGKCESGLNSDADGVINPSLIEFSYSDGKLSNGDKLIIIAKSDTYDLKLASKEYEVSGLCEKLTDVGKITEEMREKLFSSMENYEKENIFTGVDGDGPEIQDFKPDLCYLVIGKDESFIVSFAKVDVLYDSGKYSGRFLGLLAYTPALTSDGNIRFFGDIKPVGNELIPNLENESIIGFKNRTEMHDFLNTYIKDENYEVMEIE